LYAFPGSIGSEEMKFSSVRGRERAVASLKPRRCPDVGGVKPFDALLDSVLERLGGYWFEDPE
jgi:hypothetical protein